MAIGRLLALYRPDGCQVDRQETTMKKHLPLLAILKALVVRQYNTTCIAYRRRSAASQEATGYHHWASTHSGNIHRTSLFMYFVFFFIVGMLKWARSKRMAPKTIEV